MKILTWIRKVVRMHSTTGRPIVREIRRFLLEVCGEVVREILASGSPCSRYSEQAAKARLASLVFKRSQPWPY